MSDTSKAIEKQTKETLKKYGLDQCNKVLELFEFAKSAEKVALDIGLNVSDVHDMLDAAIQTKMNSILPEIDQMMNDGQKPLRNCPESDCNGKLHGLVNANGSFFICDKCNATFKPVENNKH